MRSSSKIAPLLQAFFVTLPSEMAKLYALGNEKKRSFSFAFLSFFVTLPSEMAKLYALGNEKKKSFSFAFLSFFSNFAPLLEVIEASYENIKVGIYRLWRGD